MNPPPDNDPQGGPPNKNPRIGRREIGAFLLLLAINWTFVLLFFVPAAHQRVAIPYSPTFLAQVQAGNGLELQIGAWAQASWTVLALVVFAAVALRLRGQAREPALLRTVAAAAVGEEAMTALDWLRVDVAFIGTNALSTGHGLSTPDSDEDSHSPTACRAG